MTTCAEYKPKIYFDIVKLRDVHCAIVFNGEAFRGSSRCDRSDSFNKHIGRLIAFRRAMRLLCLKYNIVREDRKIFWHYYWKTFNPTTRMKH